MSSDPPFDRPGALRGTIHGVADAHGARVYPGRRPWLRRVFFHLVAWRLDGGAVETRRLAVARQVPWWTGWLWRRRIGPGAALSFESPGIALSEYGQRFLRLGRFLGSHADSALLDAAAPALTSDTLATADFGALVCEAGDERYSGTLDWHGR
ncbi:MAG TPA: hypothetical protein VFQ39_06915, partial [Longimicrobium sp.]|nr:hypothetical protein [Longimicrobium sp.]